jgi:hypothetical protein
MFTNFQQLYQYYCHHQILQNKNKKLVVKNKDINFLVNLIFEK